MTTTMMASSGGERCGQGADFGFELPEGCIANVLALTSPRDACRLSLVASTFKSATDSDVVWEKFLPSDYKVILARADLPLLPASKKHLYLSLSDHPLLIDCGTKHEQSFSLEKSSGRKCYMLAARDLVIELGDKPKYWRWIALPDCRFPEVAELVCIYRLQICGKIITSMLSLNTTYVAFLVFMLTEEAYGSEHWLMVAAVGISGYEPESQLVYLNPRKERRFQNLMAPKVRGDGWLEIELGEYLNEGDEERVLEISLNGFETLFWKSGLIIQGIEIRPKVDIN